MKFLPVFAVLVMLAPTSALAETLEVGHYVTDQTTCQKLENVDAKNRVSHVWVTPRRDLVYGGENTCYLKGSVLNCEAQGDADDFKLPIKVGEDQRSFVLDKQDFAICKDELMASGKPMLPMKIGVYVMTGNDCVDPAYAVIQGYYGEELSYGHGSCKITAVEKTGVSHKISADCFNPDATTPIKETFYYMLKGDSAFSRGTVPNQKYSKARALRWCGPSLKSLTSGM